MTKRGQMGFWGEALGRFKQNRLGRYGLWVIAATILVAWLAPLIANNAPLMARYEGSLHFTAFRQVFPLNHFLAPDKITLKLRQNPDWLLEQKALPDPKLGWFLLPPVPYSPLQTRLDDTGSPPSFKASHYCGCDALGRDVLSRLIHGTKTSLLVGFVAVGLAAVIGIALGATAGFFGGWYDLIFVSRLIEVFLCFPTFFLIVTVVALMDPKYLNIWSIMAVIGLTSWTSIARYTRAEVMRAKESPFVAAARVIGANSRRLIFRHALPSALTPVLISVSFGLAGAILAEAGLSFLGIGVQPPEPSWGNVLRSVQSDWSQWWLGVFPGAAIFFAVLSYNLVGEALRDALDFRQG
jgi:peptide/nickel transport system permease protein